jgi:hypothetical protein
MTTTLVFDFKRKSVRPSDVTACLVTRGDQPEAIERIRRSLIFENVVVWDNSTAPFDAKCAGRYFAALQATTEIVYFQDDDVIVPPETQQALLDAYEPGVMVANWGHGDTPDGYDDLPLVCGGAICDRFLPWRAMAPYLNVWPFDHAFMYEADFVAGVLYPSFRHLHLPFEIDLAIAQHPSRLCNQPWQRDLKYQVTERARAIRDVAAVPA